MKLFGENFYFDATGYFPVGSGNEDGTEMDYKIFYGKKLFDKQLYETVVGVQYIYYDMVKTNGSFDLNELGVSFSFTNVLDFISDKLTPSYYVAKVWDQQGGRDLDGTIQAFGLNYDLEMLERHFDVGGALIYNNGILESKSGFSHANLGVSTIVELKENINLVPSVNYQISMEDTVNMEDGFWGGVSLSIKF